MATLYVSLSDTLVITITVRLLAITNTVTVTVTVTPTLTLTLSTHPRLTFTLADSLTTCTQGDVQPRSLCPLYCGFRGDSVSSQQPSWFVGHEVTGSRVLAPPAPPPVFPSVESTVARSSRKRDGRLVSEGAKNLVNAFSRISVVTQTEDTHNA